MTWDGQYPSRHNKRNWTAYERAHAGRDTGFDHDGRSSLDAPGQWHTVEDVESLTLLAGLSSTASESDLSE